MTASFNQGEIASRRRSTCDHPINVTVLDSSNFVTNNNAMNEVVKPYETRWSLVNFAENEASYSSLWQACRSQQQAQARRSLQILPVGKAYKAAKLKHAKIQLKHATQAGELQRQGGVKKEL